MLLSIGVDRILIRTTRSHICEYSISLLDAVVLLMTVDVLPSTCRNLLLLASSLVTVVRASCVHVYLVIIVL